MQQDIKDEINFHGLLRKTRIYRNFTLEQLAYGLCSVSNLHYYEIGERVPGYQIRNRLMSRLGISSEEFEDYVYDEEYELFKRVILLRESYIKCNIGEVEKSLIELKKYLREEDKILKQFVLVIQANILSRKGESEDRILGFYEQALNQTLEGYKIENLEGYVLSPEEIGIIEKIIYYTCKKDISGHKTPSIRNRMLYKKLINYVEKKEWDVKCKQKVLSGILVRFDKLFFETLSEEEKKSLIVKFNKVIDMARETGRICYIREIIYIKIRHNYEISEIEEMFIESMDLVSKIENIKEDEEQFMDLCLFDFSTVYSIPEVIKQRRKMFGLSRAKLAKGICSDKTLIRIEKKETNPQQFIVNQIFERLNLNCVYKRFEIITDDEMINNRYKEYKKALNRDLAVEADIIRSSLLKNIDKTLKQNQQVLARITNVCNKKMKKISENEFNENIKKCLNLTIPEDNISKCENYFLTRNELMLIYYLAAAGYKSCIEIVEKMLFNVQSTGMRDVNLGFCNIAFNFLASYYGNKGKYEESYKVSKYNIESMMINGRIECLPNELYNIVWNKTMEKNKDREYITTYLDVCKSLSLFLKKDNKASFYDRKRNDLLNLISLID